MTAHPDPLSLVVVHCPDSLWVRSRSQSPVGPRLGEEGGVRKPGKVLAYSTCALNCAQLKSLIQK